MERDAERLYELIWRQFLACQMPPAQYLSTSVTVAAVPAPASVAVAGRLRRAASIIASPAPAPCRSAATESSAGTQMSRQTPKSTSARNRIGFEGSTGITSTGSTRSLR